MTDLADITAPILADLSDRLEGPRRLVRACPASNGDVYVLVDRSARDEPPPPNQPHFPRTTHARPADYEVVRVHADGIESLSLRDSTAFHFVQPVPEGLLLVGARCHWRATGPEQNALVCDRSGRALRRFTLGDGIEDVRTTSDGKIWVSYFDEGVFGNYGWNNPGPEPLGATGLVAFDTTGREIFRYDASVAGSDWICDLYALNVSDEEVWAYFYTAFPLVRIRDGRYLVWAPGVTGAHALAIGRREVLLYGGYEERARVCRVRLDASMGAERVGEARFVDEEGAPLGPMSGGGVADRMYLFDGRLLRCVEAWE